MVPILVAAVSPLEVFQAVVATFVGPDFDQLSLRYLEEPVASAELATAGLPVQLPAAPDNT